MESAIKLTDLAGSVQRYQLAIDEAKVRLKLAICPGSWLMPAWIVINTEITVCYNNQLKQAGVGMKLGIDNDVNTSTKGSGPSPYGRMKIKDKPAKQPSVKPDSQGSNKQKKGQRSKQLHSQRRLPKQLQGQRRLSKHNLNQRQRLAPAASHLT